MEAIVFIILQIFFATRAVFPQLGNIRPRDAFRPIAHERKYLMDYNWRKIVFLKGLVKFMEIGNFEDLVLI